jgi:hypothetical protein
MSTVAQEDRRLLQFSLIETLAETMRLSSSEVGRHLLARLLSLMLAAFQSKRACVIPVSVLLSHFAIGELGAVVYTYFCLLCGMVIGWHHARLLSAQ